MTLTQLFTNIANAIRTKTGSSETIKAENFPTEIADITTGHLDNTEYQEANDDLDDIFESIVLPDTYQQVEYLESSGAQYIDTGRVPNNNDIIEQKFQSKNTEKDTIAWYGSMPSSSTTVPRIAMGISAAGLYVGVNLTCNYNNTITEVNHVKWRVIGSKKFEVILNGIKSEKSVSGSSTAYSPEIQLTSYLFARHGNNGVQTYDGKGTKIYFHKEYLSDGTLQLNLIPCYRKSDNVAGMYDTVSETFLTNLGSGSFIVGNDIDIVNVKIKNILEEKNEKVLSTNIKNGVSILGVTGTYEGESSGDYNAKLKPLTSSDKQVQKLITELAPLDISNATDMNYVFYTCTSLISIPEMDTSHIKTCQGLCNGCTSLVNVPILNFSELTGTNHYNMFNNCPSLSNDSLNNILAMCITMAKVTNKTLKYIGLSSTQATTCQSLSNWSDFVTAGWTSGY